MIDAMTIQHKFFVVCGQKWYNNWFHERFHKAPEELHLMTTEAPEKVEPTLDEQKAKLTQVEKDLNEAGTDHDTDKILALAKELTTLRASVNKGQKDVNKEAITGIEKSLMEGFQVLISNVKYEELTGEKIKNVLWFLQTNDTGELTGEAGIRINAGRKAPGSGSSGNGRKTVSNQAVTRTLADGTVETMTVKEVVQTYASDEIKGNSLYEPKKAWGILYPRVNRDLDPQFSEPV